MLEIIISALLPIVVTLALGYFAAWHKDFNSDQSTILNRLVMLYALPLTLFSGMLGVKRSVLMNPLMILVKIIKLRWIHILSYDQMVSRKINNQTTRCANSIFYTTLFTNSAPNYT
ncbi:AEC family transporter [Providencia sp. PROV236]|uniref:AEC family transporter n=1 Tax=Providencia sp. PROV236 TaxID=2936798 RepID=UPI0034E2336A